MAKVIVMEGVDGVGKTTFITRLKKHLKDRGYDVKTVTAFDTEEGKQLLYDFQHGDGEVLTLARRVVKCFHHVLDLAKKAPKEEVWFMDRALISTIAEQGILDGDRTVYEEVTNLAYDLTIKADGSMAYVNLTAPLDIIKQRQEERGELDKREKAHSLESRYAAYSKAALAMRIISTPSLFIELLNDGSLTDGEQYNEVINLINRMSD